jgi:hypothetical protein
VDAASDDPAWTHAQRGVDLDPQRAARVVRFSRLYIRTTPLSEGWPLVSGREPVEEERPTAQDQGRRDLGPRQSSTMARRTRPAQQPAAGLVNILLLWDTPDRLPGCRQLRLQHGPALPYSAPQGVVARHHALSCSRRVRKAWRASATPRSYWRPIVSLEVKPVGERSAGNPRAAFDERGRETESRHAGLRRRRERAVRVHRKPTTTAPTAPVLASTTQSSRSVENSRSRPGRCRRRTLT